jgi:hypothetical protein
MPSSFVVVKVQDYWCNMMWGDQHIIRLESTSSVRRHWVSRQTPGVAGSDEDTVEKTGPADAPLSGSTVRGKKPGKGAWHGVCGRMGAEYIIPVSL